MMYVFPVYSNIRIIILFLTILYFVIYYKVETFFELKLLSLTN